MMYIALGVTVDSLTASVDKYYREHRMADGFARVQAIPSGASATIRRIDGIQDVELRHVQEVRVVMPDNDKIIILRLKSVPNQRDTIHINNVGLNQGSDLRFDSDIWTANEFMEIHSLEIGDNITVIVGGQERRLNIVGTVHSPEYIYMVRGLDEMLPDPETFSVAYMTASALGNLLGRSGVYNDLVFTLNPGYEFDDVESELEDILTRYGLTHLYAREYQISASLLQVQLDSMTAMTGSIPAVFMFMAIVILYLMLRRVIEQDRMQIGTLKAFGYSNGAILAHYMFYGAATGALGGLLGSILGYISAGAMFDMLAEFFKIPYSADSPMFAYILTSFAIGILSGAAGAFMGASSILKLNPAEAMRAPAPKLIKHDILKVLPFLKHILTSFGLMSVRSIMRSKVRSAFVAVGIMFVRHTGVCGFVQQYDRRDDAQSIYTHPALRYED